MNTHITYETAKALKSFCPELPEPIKGEMGDIWIYDPECPEDGLLQGVSLSAGDYPAYQLHDLLSKPFCEALAGKISNRNRFYLLSPEGIGANLNESYWLGGLPAVEKALLEMMGGK